MRVWPGGDAKSRRDSIHVMMAGDDALAIVQIRSRHESVAPTLIVKHVLAIMEQEPSHSLLSTYCYPLLFVAWTSVTGLAFLRVSRQPYNARIKSEQYETIFKGTSLAAALIGMGLGGTLNKRRSEVTA